MKKKGKLIVIDGADGSGKATQTKLLVSRLKKEGYKVRTLDFPQYQNNFFGQLIGDCLSGKYGDFIGLDPHIASVLYAADRFESKKKLDEWLGAGCIVVLDRYVSANQIHQGGKISDPRQRKKFLEWLDFLEYSIFHLPRPSLVLYLDVSAEISDKLLGEQESLKKNSYTKGKKDVAESNFKHQEQSREGALRIIQKANNWVRVRCFQGDTMFSREVIHDRIWSSIQKAL